MATAESFTPTPIASTSPSSRSCASAGRPSRGPSRGRTHRDRGGTGCRPGPAPSARASSSSDRRTPGQSRVEAADEAVGHVEPVVEVAPAGVLRRSARGVVRPSSRRRTRLAACRGGMRRGAPPRARGRSAEPYRSTGCRLPTPHPGSRTPARRRSRGRGCRSARFRARARERDAHAPTSDSTGCQACVGDGRAVHLGAGARRQRGEIAAARASRRA